MKLYGLEQTATMQILFFLEQHKEVITKELTEGVPVDYRTINRAMDVLVKLGLADNEYRRGQPTKRYIWITEKGRKVVELLKEVENVL